MTARRRPVRGEAGLTLIEVLVTVAILGIAFVTVVGGMAVSIAGSDVHRKQATSQTVLRNLAEYLKAVPYVCPGDYSATVAEFSTEIDTPVVAPYDPLAVPTSGVSYTVEVESPAMVWNGQQPGNFVSPSATDVCPDSGLQRLTLRVRSVARADLPPEELLLVKRES